ncbi:alpha/beta fold hydrolase [Streptomyces althioticus]|jgi:pimeloyl-ACP methyl ester carboxylesterase|uniref:alpha/beta fold hydrolase n=1 Tax=Streptomyces TaxID=1883 RepID=UPI00177D7504|nr:alpha/beta fold hydrolase [Streptomyces althioticus]GGQ47337.1 hydrolase [Streptomyces griseorubens]
MTHASDLRFLPSADGDLAYRDTGSGDLVVLLHSGFVDHRIWDDHVPLLAERYRVVAPDTRGHGFSANATAPFRWADDLAALLRHLDAGPAVLVGLSMGGVIATDTVLEHPGLVRAVVTAGAVTGDFRYTDAWHRELQDTIAGALAAGDVTTWLDAFLRLVPGPGRSADDIDPEIPRRVREMALHTLSKHSAGEKDWLVPVTGSLDRAGEIRVPLLAVNGALEPAELHAAAERLAAAVPDGRTATLEDTGHYSAMERPDAFVGVLLDFLESGAAAPRQVPSSAPVRVVR